MFIKVALDGVSECLFTVDTIDEGAEAGK